MCIYVYVCTYVLYVHVCIFVCMYCICFCICMCVQIYIYIFSHSLSWPPLFLDTSNTRRNAWCPQHSTYPITHWHRQMQNQMKTEEVTLQPTATLKRIYTPLSVKVLFPLNQCKSSFHKFTSNFIKTCTSQCNKNMIHNLSDHTLTDDEFSVLTKGLSFVPTPTKTFKKDTKKC